MHFIYAHLFQRSSVSRMSMGMVHNLNMPTCQFAAYNPNIYAKGMYVRHLLAFHLARHQPPTDQSNTPPPPPLLRSQPECN